MFRDRSGICARKISYLRVKIPEQKRVSIVTLLLYILVRLLGCWVLHLRTLLNGELGATLLGHHQSYIPKLHSFNLRLLQLGWYELCDGILFALKCIVRRITFETKESAPNDSFLSVALRVLRLCVISGSMSPSPSQSHEAAPLSITRWRRVTWSI
jgi:hypothetical protein